MRISDWSSDVCSSDLIGLVVLCAYGWGGTSEFPFGGTVHKVLASTEIAYLLVRPGGGAGEAQPYRRVLVPFDGSRGAEWGVTLAASIPLHVEADIGLGAEESAVGKEGVR